MKDNLRKFILFLVPLLALLWLSYYIQSVNSYESYMSYITVVILYCLFVLLLCDTKFFLLEKIHKVRYYLAVILFIFLVAFKFHGSSIANWDQLYKDYGEENVQTTVLEGTPRPIRSDEWLVQTPLYLSQVMKEDKLTRVNENIRSDGEDMVLAAYSPVLDVTILGKPFNWGFIFLDTERGFSWYWCLKVISLFMFSYEMSLMLSKRNKEISLLGAICITLSPAIQWWFSTFVADIIIFAQGAIVATYYYFRSNGDVKKKILNLVLFVICGIGFILSLYPPIQVSLGYLCAIIFIYLVVKNKEKIKKKDIIYFAIASCIIIATISYFIFTAKEAISLMLGTAYPGARVEHGGNLDSYMISGYAFSWLLPYKDVPVSNPSELSSFISLLPLSFILFFFRKKDDEDNNLIIFIYVYILIMMLFSVIGFPEKLAKLTLFSYVSPQRLMIIVGLASTYLLIMLLSNIACRENKINILISSIVTIISSIIMCLSLYNTDAYKYLTDDGFIVSIVVFTVMIYLWVRGYIKYLVPYTLIFMVMAGFFVNPIARTLSPIYEKEVFKNAVRINKENPGKWASIENIYGASLLEANGLKVFNGVHYYPDLEMWRSLDTENIYENVYNRYAHVVVGITTEKTNFELIQPDVIKVNVNFEELYKIGIKYLLINENLNVYNTTEKNRFKELYYNVIDDTYIYEVVE
ncbi:MAG: hypothetical protein E7214_02990 [Clostridium sp.]|nr:hypothetical protein [Clostridium sp.]